MRVLWAPWRMVYLTGAATESCIFCPAPGQDRREALILGETADALVMLNRYPYASGHLMVAPRRHVGDPALLSEQEFVGLMLALRSTIDILGRDFQPQGMNVGMNIGRAAGAGIDAHLHWHAVPRWNGDTNFMPMLADVRVMPEHLEATYDRLRPHFASLAG